MHGLDDFEIGRGCQPLRDLGVDKRLDVFASFAFAAKCQQGKHGYPTTHAMHVFDRIPWEVKGQSIADIGNFIDREMDKLFDAMNQTGDVDEQRSLMRQFEKRGLDEQANSFITLWWYRIIPHRSYLKGWKISPSHYLNQDLSGVWLEK